MRYHIAGWAYTKVPEALFGKPVITEKTTDPRLQDLRHIDLTNDEVLSLLDTNNIAIVNLKSGGRLIFLEEKGKMFTMR